MSKSGKLKELKKGIVLECPACLRVYELLEIHYQDKEFIDVKCLLSCKEKWNQLLIQDHHSKEAIVNLDSQNKKEKEKNADKTAEEFLKSLAKKEKK